MGNFGAHGQDVLPTRDAAQASELFSDSLLQHLLAQARVSHRPIQARVLRQPIDHRCRCYFMTFVQTLS